MQCLSLTSQKYSRRILMYLLPRSCPEGASETSNTMKNRSVRRLFFNSFCSSRQKPGVVTGTVVPARSNPDLKLSLLYCSPFDLIGSRYPALLHRNSRCKCQKTNIGSSRVDICRVEVDLEPRSQGPFCNLLLQSSLRFKRRRGQAVIANNQVLSVQSISVLLETLSTCSRSTLYNLFQ